MIAKSPGSFSSHALEPKRHSGAAKSSNLLSTSCFSRDAFPGNTTSHRFTKHSARKAGHITIPNTPFIAMYLAWKQSYFHIYHIVSGIAIVITFPPTGMRNSSSIHMPVRMRSSRKML